MNILVVGCGQVGLHLVRQLEDAGHDLAVLDESAERLRQLERLEGGPFGGVALVGMPIDVEVLRQAGIEACDAVAAVSDDDRINIMAAQIAQEVFGIRQVVARIADPRLEEIYAGQFGLKTICPTRLTVGAALAALAEAPAAQNGEAGEDHQLCWGRTLGEAGEGPGGRQTAGTGRSSERRMTVPGVKGGRTLGEAGTPAAQNGKAGEGGA